MDSSTNQHGMGQHQPTWLLRNVPSGYGTLLGGPVEDPPPQQPGKGYRVNIEDLLSFEHQTSCTCNTELGVHCHNNHVGADGAASAVAPSSTRQQSHQCNGDGPGSSLPLPALHETPGSLPIGNPLLLGPPFQYSSSSDATGVPRHAANVGRSRAADAAGLLLGLAGDDIAGGVSELEAGPALEAPAGLDCDLMPHQLDGLRWLVRHEEGPHKGGVLADGMGLGKTVQAIALMLARPPAEGSDAPRTTLVVAPVALLDQWPREIHEKIKPRHELSVIKYHGAAKAKMTASELLSHDVVVTSYEALAVEYRRKQRREYNFAGKPPRLLLLDQAVRFHRVILDECHTIKNRTTNASNGAAELQATYRLCMSGTPIMNSIDELYSLLRFLRIRPYNNWRDFHRDIRKPVMHKDAATHMEGLKRLREFLPTVLLQRTKQSRTASGDPILTLPARINTDVYVVLDSEQRDFYNHLEKKTATNMNRYKMESTLAENMNKVLIMLLRLRQACCHPHMIMPAPAEPSTPQAVELAKKLNADVVRRLGEASEQPLHCVMCMDQTYDVKIFVPCGHYTCSSCLSLADFFSKRETCSDDETSDSDDETSDNEATCPLCRGVIDGEQVVPYRDFLKVYMPEKLAKLYPDEVDWFDGDKDDDDEEDYRSENENDADSLVEFIASDSEDDNDADATYGEARNATTGGKRKAGSRPSGSWAKNKKAKSSSIKDEEDEGRGKVKGKGKGEEMKKGEAKAKATTKAENIPTTMAELKHASRRNARAKRQYMQRLEADFIPSAKTDRVLDLLGEIAAADPSEKTIVFSSFTSFLDLLEVPVRQRLGPGYYRRYDGGMSPAQRDAAVAALTHDPDVKVLLLSLRAGNAGLNLTRASHVIIVDPSWNPFVEDQAVDRAHRIGQRRTVKVHRLIVAGTVEDKVKRLQDRKRAIVSGVLDDGKMKALNSLGVEELTALLNGDTT